MSDLPDNEHTPQQGAGNGEPGSAAQPEREPAAGDSAAPSGEENPEAASSGAADSGSDPVEEALETGLSEGESQAGTPPEAASGSAEDASAAAAIGDASAVGDASAENADSLPAGSEGAADSSPEAAAAPASTLADSSAAESSPPPSEASSADAVAEPSAEAAPESAAPAAVAKSGEDYNKMYERLARDTRRDSERRHGVSRDDDDDDDDEDEEEESGGLLHMNFWGHIEDLRWVIVKSVIVFILAMVLMMFFSIYAQKLLTWPLQYGMSISGVERQTIELRTDGPFSVFTFMLQLWVFGGLLLSLPFIVYFASGFIAPGLTPREKKMLRPVAFASLGLFVVGCLFAFFLLLPTYMAVSLTLERMFGFASLWTPANYYGAVVWTTLGLGLVFEFPLVLVILQVLGLVETNTLRRFRRHTFVFLMVFAAFLTPGGDPITLLITTIPLYLLFEAAMLIGERLGRRKKELGDFEDFDDLDDE